MKKAIFLVLPYYYKNYSLGILRFWEENKQMKTKSVLLGLNWAEEQILR